MIEFDFMNSFNSTRGILLLDDVHFFYYGFSLDYEMGESYYNWNAEIEQFITEKGLDIQHVDESKIPVEPKRNTLYFALDERYNEDKTHAFFRHLRNAFAHYRIAKNGNDLCLTDYDPGKKTFTMSGLIKYKDFKELCQLFFNQKAEIIERIENSRLNLEPSIDE